MNNQNKIIFSESGDGVTIFICDEGTFKFDSDYVAVVPDSKGYYLVQELIDGQKGGRELFKLPIGNTVIIYKYGIKHSSINMEFIPI